MNIVVTCCWAFLALLHLPPSLVLFNSSLIDKLYGVSSSGDIGALLMHRGLLFFTLVLATTWAIFSVEARPLVSLLLAVSILGFLLVYWRSGTPPSLARIALADLIALGPLLLVCHQAWSNRAG